MLTLVTLQQPAAPTPPTPPTPAAPFGIPSADFAKLNQQMAKLAEMQVYAEAQGGGQSSFKVLNVGSGPGGVPMNAAEMRALRVQRAEMSDQLTNVAERREGLVQQLAKTQGAVARGGLEARIAVLDKRIVDIEREMARTGELVMMAPASLQRITANSSTQTVAERAAGWNPSDGAMIAISIVFTLSVLMPLAITAARIWWRRAVAAGQPRSKGEIDRLERLEGAVETVAIEMERVSEGQRFVTRLLTEGRGEAPPVFAPRREAVPAMNVTMTTKGQGER